MSTTEDKRQSMVYGQINDAEDALRRLQDIVVKLQERLLPVLSESPLTEAKQGESPQLPPLALTIRNLALGILNQEQILKHLHDRIEV